MSARKKPKIEDEAPPKTERERMSFYISSELGEGLRNAVAAVPRLTLASIAEDALRAQLHKLEKLYNDGKPFPARETSLKPGRRVK